MSNFYVKYATTNDAVVIEKIDSEYDFERYSHANIFSSLSDKNTINLIAYDDNIAIGYISVNYIFDEANLLKIVVSKHYRNRGVGTLLVNNIIDELKVLGIKNLLLEVRQDNKVAIDFYSKFGFKKIHERQKYYNDGETADILLCLL